MPTSCLPMRPLLPKPMRMRPLPKLKPMRLLPKFKPMRMQLLPMQNFPLPVMVSLLAIIGPTSKVVVVVVLVTMAAVMVLVTMAAVVALVMVVAETVVEAWIDKARINFVFLLSTKIGNTYTYTRHVIDSKKRESQSQWRERIVSLGTVYYFIIYSISQKCGDEGNRTVFVSSPQQHNTPSPKK